MRVRVGFSFLSSYVGLDPASTIHPPKISRISSTPKVFEILASPKISTFLYLDPKMHEIDS